MKSASLQYARRDCGQSQERASHPSSHTTSRLNTHALQQRASFCFLWVFSTIQSDLKVQSRFCTVGCINVWLFKSNGRIHHWHLPLGKINQVCKLSMTRSSVSILWHLMKFIITTKSIRSDYHFNRNLIYSTIHSKLSFKPTPVLALVPFTKTRCF